MQLIRFLIRLDESLNPIYGRSAIGAEIPIVIPSVALWMRFNVTWDITLNCGVEVWHRPKCCASYLARAPNLRLQPLRSGVSGLGKAFYLTAAAGMLLGMHSLQLRHMRSFGLSIGSGGHLFSTSRSRGGGGGMINTYDVAFVY